MFRKMRHGDDKKWNVLTNNTIFFAAIANNPEGPINWQTPLEKIVEERRQNKEIYSWFYDHVLSHVAGHLNWKKYECSYPAMKRATVSDEALALVILENSWNTWRDKAEGKAKVDIERPRYTFVDITE